MLILDKAASPLAKIHWLVTWLVRVSLLLAGFGAVLDASWGVLFVACLAFLLTFLPRLVERNYRVHLPIEFEIVIVLFIYATLFLGDVSGYYTRFWWWDIVLHTGSGMALGFMGFILVYMLHKGKKIEASPALVALLALSFALAMGALWEILEFTIDSAFGTNMQKSGLVDTMWDLIVDCVGAVLASLMGYLYLRGRRPHLFERAIRAFAEKNPELFGSERKEKDDPHRRE